MSVTQTSDRISEIFLQDNLHGFIKFFQYITFENEVIYLWMIYTYLDSPCKSGLNIKSVFVSDGQTDRQTDTIKKL